MKNWSSGALNCTFHTDDAHFVSLGEHYKQEDYKYSNHIHIISSFRGTLRVFMVCVCLFRIAYHHFLIEWWMKHAKHTSSGLRPMKAYKYEHPSIVQIYDHPAAVVLMSVLQ